MNPEQFVAALRTEVHDSTVRGVPEMFDAPPGRAPAKELLELSAWYRALPEPDRAMVRRIVAHSSSSTLFGVPCVLDGARVIKDPPDRGKLVLVHTGARGHVVLNDSAIDLHDLW